MRQTYILIAVHMALAPLLLAFAWFFQHGFEPTNPIICVACAFVAGCSFMYAVDIIADVPNGGK